MSFRRRQGDACATGNEHLINNRQQQGGRRRGRGGQRPQGMQGNSGGNARDTRQRGNAAQLLEKYKSMARDAQLAGDRVQTEYYLQFADHYFRVLEEGRSRFEDQQQTQQRRRQRDDDDFESENDDEEGMSSEGVDDGDTSEEDDDRPQRHESPRQPQQQRLRRDRPERTDRAERQDRAERPERTDRAERQDRAERPERTDRPRREAANEARGDRDGNVAETDVRIPLSVLPPAIGAVGGDDESAEAPRPRRRVRRPASDDGSDIAPAA